MWLWHRGSRLTPEESTREYLANAADEYDTLIEYGEDRTKAWQLTLGAVSERSFCSPERNDPTPGVGRLGDLERAVRFYRTSDLAEISRLDRDLRGVFSTCPKCRLTYLIEYRAMHYAAGKTAAERVARQVNSILPGQAGFRWQGPQTNCGSRVWADQPLAGDTVAALLNRRWL